MRALDRFPLLVLLMLLGSALMLIPCLFAARQADWPTARTFLYHGIFFAVIAVMLGLGTMQTPAESIGRRQLANLVAAYLLLPAVFAAPVAQLVPTITYTEAYLEMASSLTTTGTTVFQDSGAISGGLHLWRATVAWMGGLMILVAAAAVFEPMHLGGFEIDAAIRGQRFGQRALGGATRDNARLWRMAQLLTPAYVGLTAALAVCLSIAGDKGLVALSHAMSVLSTSGISPLGDSHAAASGRAGEAVMFLFLFFAVTRRAIFALATSDRHSLSTKDPEISIAGFCVLVLPLLLFLRHFLGAIEVNEAEDAAGAISALWGSLFTVLSFLTTMGFESADWVDAQRWSGLQAPGLVLLGLVTLGGGIATTAGGLKLLRSYALYKHGLREMQRLVHPAGIGGAGVTARRIRREAAFIAFSFLGLFTLCAALFLIIFAGAGFAFEDALAMSMAALTNCGPVVAAVNPTITLAGAGPLVQLAFCAAMILGRLEVLVALALINPDYWRR